MSKAKDNEKDSRLVYSSDPALNQKCRKCKELLSECTCLEEVDLKTALAHSAPVILRIEKSGRAGKTVTVLDKLPRNETYLKELTSQLKKLCGAGGTYFIKNGVGIIEIQGEKSDLIRQFLSREKKRTS